MQQGDEGGKAVRIISVRVTQTELDCIERLREKIKELGYSQHVHVSTTAVMLEGLAALNEKFSKVG